MGEKGVKVWARCVLFILYIYLTVVDHLTGFRRVMGCYKMVWTGFDFK